MTAVEELERLVGASRYGRSDDFRVAANAFDDAARVYSRSASDPGWTGKAADDAVDVFIDRARRIGSNIDSFNAAARIVAAANEAIDDASEMYQQLPPSIVPDDVADVMSNGGSVALGGFGVLSGPTGLVFVSSVLRWQRERAARKVLVALNERLVELAERLNAVIGELDVPRGSQPPEVPEFPLARQEAGLTPWQLGAEWLTGEGNTRRFVETDDFTQLLRTHPYYDQIRSDIRDQAESLAIGSFDDPNYGLSGIEGVGKYVGDYSTLLTAGTTGNLAVTYLGSHQIHWEVVGQRPNGDWEVEFSVTNSSSLQSATRPPMLGYEPWYQDSIGAATDEFSARSGIGRETTQVITWTETIER